MATSIDAREHDVQHAFQHAFAIARGATTASLHEIETSLWRAMLALGRALIALYLARVVAPTACDRLRSRRREVQARGDDRI